MKKLILSCSLMALTLPAYAADTINCATLPTCSELGYTENASNCVGKKTLCPFDKTKATCIDSPHVGDLKYSLYSSNHDGWLRCDGRQYKIDDYRQLYDVIKLNFCHQYTSRTDTAYSTSNCDADYFAVPDYRGFYLRGLNASLSASYTIGAPSSYYGYALKYKGDTGTVTNVYTPQYERLPNITGKAPYTAPSQYQNTISGAFYTATVSGSSGSQRDGSYGIGFDASRSNVIYDGTHVRPAHYGAYIFIYAGE